MRHALRRVWLAGCVVALVAAAGCATTQQPTRFYVLTPLPAAPPASARGPAVGLRPVSLPAELDRPQIVTRTGENTVELAEFDRWAGPLAENFTQVLAQDLAALIPTERVAVFPWGKNTPVDYEVTVDVARSDGSLGGNCTLLAYWTVARRGGGAVATHATFTRTEPAGPSYTTLVSATSRLIAALGQEIAQAVRAASH